MPSSPNVKAVQVPLALFDALVAVSADQYITVASLVRQVLAHELYPLPEGDDRAGHDPYYRREGRIDRHELTPECPAYVSGGRGRYWDDRRSAGRRRAVPQ